MSGFDLAATFPRKKPDLVLEIIDDEVLIYDARRGSAVYLNPTAALIWGLCDGRRSVAEICDALREGYPDAASLPAHVAEALSSLRESGVLLFD